MTWKFGKVWNDYALGADVVSIQYDGVPLGEFMAIGDVEKPIWCLNGFLFELFGEHEFDTLFEAKCWLKQQNLVYTMKELLQRQII